MKNIFYIASIALLGTMSAHAASKEVIRCSAFENGAQAKATLFRVEQVGTDSGAEYYARVSTTIDGKLFRSMKQSVKRSHAFEGNASYFEGDDGTFLVKLSRNVFAMVSSEGDWKVSGTFVDEKTQRQIGFNEAVNCEFGK